MNRWRNYPQKFFWRAYTVCLVVSLVLGAYGMFAKAFHYHFAFQYIPQFFALLGFIGCILLIVIAKAIGRFLVVEEDYYDKK